MVKLVSGTNYAALSQNEKLYCGLSNAVGDQEDREISNTTWADNSELNPRGIREELWNIIFL